MGVLPVHRTEGLQSVAVGQGEVEQSQIGHIVTEHFQPGLESIAVDELNRVPGGTTEDGLDQGSVVGAVLHEQHGDRFRPVSH
jgi:hypothetical protein